MAPLSEMNAYRPQTLVELFRVATNRGAAAELLRYKEDGRWIGLTGAQLFKEVRKLACGLYSLGVRKGDRVAMLAESGPLWTISDYAILANGAINVPIYPTQAVEQVDYILREVEPKLFLISNARQASRIGRVLKDMADLPVVSFQVMPDLENALSLEEVLSRGARLVDENPQLFDAISSEVKPTDLASIVYTSGTTGEPKGAMLTHSNLVFNAIASGEYLEIEPGNLMLSYLPLSHIFERTVLYLCLYFGVQINYAGGLDTIASDLLEVRPTLMSTVPRLLERVYARMQRRACEAGPIRQKIFRWSVSVARRTAELELAGEPVPPLLELERQVADHLVLARLREALGGRIKRMVSGGAALSPELALLFNGAGIPLLEGYGLTETSPVISVNTLRHNKIGTVGRPIPGVQVKIADDGEILTRGPHVFQGYFKKPKETEAAFTADEGPPRWFKTGDVGRMDEDGFLIITDRKKDLIKTSAGKYVAPQAIEARLCQSEFIEQVVVLGSDRKYVSALIVPDFERLRAWAAEQSIEFETTQGLVSHPRVIHKIKSEVNRLTSDLADYEKVKRIALLANQFTIEGGELTPTLKVRRRFIEKKYKGLIEALYSGAG